MPSNFGCNRAQLKSSGERWSVALAAHVVRLRRVDFFDRMKNFREFFIAEEEIDVLMAAGIFEADGLRGDVERIKKSGGASGAGRGTTRSDQPADERNTGSSFTCHTAGVLKAGQSLV